MDTINPFTLVFVKNFKELSFFCNEQFDTIKEINNVYEQRK